MAATAPRYDVVTGMPLTRAAAVAQWIRDMIVSGELPLGSRLRQNDLAAKLGVSSTPVREAFLALARQGLVHLDTHRGAVVFEPTSADIQENYEMRIALESLAAELAAKQIDKADLDRLDVLLEEMREALASDIERHTTVLNPRFHALIYRAAQRPRLMETIEMLRDTAVVYQALLVQPTASPHWLQTVQREHEDIVAALRARAPKRAAAATRTHLSSTLAQVLARLTV
jgi:DNA-binding GntR family transcriptional regulator